MKTVSGFLFASLLMCFLVLVSSGTAKAVTLYVDASNTTGIEDGTVDHPYNTIMEGINSAVNGDIVRVSAGTYNENVSITSKQISLIGESPANTTIQAANNVISISGTFSAGAEIVEIANFAITGGTNSGIYLNSTTVYGLIHNDIIIGNYNGIYASASDATVYNNAIVNNTNAGFYAYNTGTSITAINNIIVNNMYGIRTVTNSPVVSATYNNVWSNTSGDFTEINGTLNQSDNICVDPQFLANYQLSAASPCINAGRPIAADNDPDGTRNNQGAYGGPGAADFWPSPSGGPVVTNLSVTPPSVPTGGTISIQATGEIR